MLSLGCLGVFGDDIDFVLQDDQVLQLHDLDSSQMFRGLWLRARFVSCDKKQSSIHDSCTSEHSCHENVVTWAIDKGNVASQEHDALASWAFGSVFFRRGIRTETVWSWALSAFIQLGVGITKFNGDVSNFFFKMLDSVDS